MNVTIKRKLTKEEYVNAQKQGAKTLLSESDLFGFGCQDVRLIEEKGKYYLTYVIKS